VEALWAPDPLDRASGRALRTPTPKYDKYIVPPVITLIFLYIYNPPPFFFFFFSPPTFSTTTSANGLCPKRSGGGRGRTPERQARIRSARKVVRHTQRRRYKNERHRQHAVSTEFIRGARNAVSGLKLLSIRWARKVNPRQKIDG
jgi:hypothetical protein